MHVLNRLPRSNTPIGFNCPLSAWRGKDLVDPTAQLHPFGCEAWAIDNREVSKGKSISIVKQPGTPGIFIGLDARHGCYRILSLKYKRVFNTVDVKFDELSFPAVELRHYDADILRDIKRNELLAEDDTSDPMVGVREGGDAPGAPPPWREADVEDASDSDEFDEHGDAQPILKRRSKRDREDHMSDKAREVYLDNVLRQPIAQTGLEATLFKLIAKQTQGDGCVKANFDDLKMRLRSEPKSEPMLALLYSAEQVAMNIPLSLKQADASKERDEWLEARLKHLKLIDEFDTYDLVDLPKGSRPIPTKWVFAAKGKDEGFRKTARLVMLGFMQREGVDFYETFSPVVRWGVVRLLLALWTVNDWPVAEKVDLKQAFNSTPIDVPMYVKQPPGYSVQGEGDKVWRIKKSLPGGRQCSRMLHLALKNLVMKAGFQQCVTEECVFIYRNKKSISMFIILVIWVDDMFFFANYEGAHSKIDAMCDDLRKAKYVIHRLGDITTSHVLGCEVKRDRRKNRTSITQNDFVQKLLRTTTNAGGVPFWDAPIKKKVRSPVSSEVRSLSAADNAQSSDERAKASVFN